MTWSEVALVAATGVHAGFQLTVTFLVYPALLDVDADRWDDAHRRHSRRITPVVGVVYGGLLAAVAWVVADGTGPWGWTTAAAVGAVVLTTAVGAAPVHGALGRLDAGPDGARVAVLRRRLVRADRLRCALAAVALVAAVALAARA